MATQGSKVVRADYNNIYITISQILGTGPTIVVNGITYQSGYGQTLNMTLPSVGTTDKIRQVHWANLRLDLLRIANHQGISENASWTAGNTNSIPTLPSLSTTTKLSASTITAYENALDVLKQPSNLYRLGAGQFSDELLVTSQRTTSWNSTISHYFTIDFGSATNARYFFNAGGQIRITPSFTKTSSTTINNDWETLINGVGTLVFNWEKTTLETETGTQVSSIGFYDLNNTVSTQLYTRTGGSQNTTYSVNDYTVRVYCDVANNSTGTARYIYFQVEFKDDKTVNPNFDESVTGTVTNTIRMYRPSGANVSVTAPTASNTVTL